MRFIILAIVCLIQPGQLCYAQGGSDSRASLFGYTLGMSGQEAQQVRQFESATTTDAYVRHVIIGGVDFNVAVSLLSGRVAVVSAQFPPKDFELILQALRDKFGNYKLETSTIKTGAGVEYEQASASWGLPDGSVAVLKRYSSSIEEGSLLLTSKEMIEKLSRDHEKRLQDLKKGL